MNGLQCCHIESQMSERKKLGEKRNLALLPHMGSSSCVSMSALHSSSTNPTLKHVHRSYLGMLTHPLPYRLLLLVGLTSSMNF